MLCVGVNISPVPVPSLLRGIAVSWKSGRKNVAQEK